MGVDDGSSTAIQFNPKLCALLRHKSRPKHATTSPPKAGPERLVGSALVQRLRHENFQLAVKEFLRQPDTEPTVPQDVALNHYARRTHNSLRSHEMLAKVAKEEARLRREPFAQTLAKDISRRHFRSAHRYHTGSKYPEGGFDLHAPEARAPVLEILRSGKLQAMTGILLAHSGSMRVGPQPRSESEVGSRVVCRHGSPPRQHVALDRGAMAEIVVPALDATRYALALYSPGRSFKRSVGHGDSGIAGSGVRQPALLQAQSSGVRDLKDNAHDTSHGDADSEVGSAMDDTRSVEEGVAERGSDQGEVGSAVSENPSAALAELIGEALPGFTVRLPLGVQQHLLSDSLTELLAVSRSLVARVESVLGQCSEPSDGGRDAVSPTERT